MAKSQLRKDTEVALAAIGSGLHRRRAYVDTSKTCQRIKIVGREPWSVSAAECITRVMVALNPKKRIEVYHISGVNSPGNCIKIYS
jgi:hypothetical protein